MVQLIKDIGDIKGANSIRSSVPIGPLRKWDLMNYSYSKARRSVLPTFATFNSHSKTSRVDESNRGLHCSSILHSEVIVTHNENV